MSDEYLKLVWRIALSSSADIDVLKHCAGCKHFFDADSCWSNEECKERTLDEIIEWTKENYDRLLDFVERVEK